MRKPFSVESGNWEQHGGLWDLIVEDLKSFSTFEEAYRDWQKNMHCQHNRVFFETVDDTYVLLNKSDPPKSSA